MEYIQKVVSSTRIKIEKADEQELEYEVESEHCNFRVVTSGELVEKAVSEQNQEGSE